ncbi:MAG: sodium:proton antiporter [Methanomicrobiaceae archaeon]|nr:sodium:proton antiporter [Methanomicrobiaceae archaeon]
MNMSRIVRSTANILFPFILVFGFYIIVHGHLTPGGGFQGGAVAATGFVLLLVAFSPDIIRDKFSFNSMKYTEALGLLLFIITAFVAIALGTTFFFNWLANGGIIFGESVAFGANPGILNSAGTIPLMNVAVGIEVIGAMGLIIMYMLSGIEGGNKE